MSKWNIRDHLRRFINAMFEAFEQMGRHEALSWGVNEDWLIKEDASQTTSEDEQG